ncbi:SAM-dependent methyltransferase [Massilia sp. W12]|uniref:class I SAM-dependent methyltransferase n=1 Tax=Massilia sp. W12 TaxID=3126507 RepID=UPI0030CFBB5C
MPDPDALTASCQLLELLAARIAEAGGLISFAEYMNLALYAPGLGYYAGGATKLGKDGDFTTAPEISPLFGGALARIIAPLLEQSAPAIIEFGAGSGQLAYDILHGLQQQGIALPDYAILELSAELRARQQQKLAGLPVRWLERLPHRFDGVMLGNEVLDAMPVHLVEKQQDGGWLELGVGIEAGRLCWRKMALSLALAEQIALQIPDIASLPPAYVTELHPQACAFIRSTSELLARGRGAALWIDYGFAAHQYYLPQRMRGTLYCHYRHHAHDEPFFLPGLQDITAHVEFSSLAKIAEDAGLDVLSYSNQAGFLMEAGITTLLEALDPARPAQYLPQAAAAGKLLAAHEMGELFKVLLLGRHVTLPPGWGRIARQAAL